MEEKRNVKKRILITVVILFLIQLLAGIPTPGVNLNYFKSLLEQNTTAGLFDVLSGNGLSNLSITMLSITPYITASIILQLLTIVIRPLEKLQRSGEVGQQTFKKYTVILGVFLAFAEAFGFAYGFGQRGLLLSFKWYWVMLVTIIWAGVALFLMLAGEYIEKKGFGNGISLILLFNILSSYPADAMTIYKRFLQGYGFDKGLRNSICICIILVVLFAFTVYIQFIEKKILVEYSSKTVGDVKSERSFFPVKLCPGTVVPVIFASSLMAIPTLVASLMGKDFWIANMLNSSMWFDPEHISYSGGAIIYVVLIFMFTYFYTEMIINPLEIANNFKKTGGTIPNIRPGQDTANYLTKEIRKTITIGAVALSLIALVPCVLSGLFNISKLSFAGTSIIIIVGVIVETLDRLNVEVKANKMKLI